MVDTNKRRRENDNGRVDDPIFTMKHGAEKLSRSEHGRSAMKHVLAWLDDDGLSLDSNNQNAILMLLRAAWGGYAGTARDVMREAVGE